VTKDLVIETRPVVEYITIGRSMVYVTDVRPGTYPMEMFIDELKRVSIISPTGLIKWDEVISALQRNNFIELINRDVVVKNEFSNTVPVDRYETQTVEKRMTRRVPTMVGILRWAADKQKGKTEYLRVKEILIYWTPTNPQVLDDDMFKLDFFKSLIECTPMLQKWGFGIDSIMSPTKQGWATPYNKAANSGKAVFEVAETTAEYPDGFWEYSDYNIDEFNSALEAVERGDMDFEDLKLWSRGGKSMESGVLDVEKCLKEVWKRNALEPYEIVKKKVKEG
jgi:hypothetical protein